MRKLFQISVLWLILASAGCGGPQQDPPVPTPTPDIPQLLQDDANKPRFAGVVAGIRLYSGLGPDRGFEIGCPELYERASADLARATHFEVEPSYLPPDIWPGFSDNGSTFCQGTLVGASRGWAHFSIQRVLRPEPWNYSHAPADRISAGSINGRPAVFVRPVLPDGRGGAIVTFAVQVPEGWIVTQVMAELPLSEVIKIAESLGP